MEWCNLKQFGFEGDEDADLLFHFEILNLLFDVEVIQLHHHNVIDVSADQLTHCLLANIGTRQG